MKILHIASFKGNIGDNANHIGFRDWFEKLVKHNVEWENIEIREFYRSIRKWDNDFVEEANACDLVIIGGGNYFELWVEKSPTGTSIEIPLDLIRKIETPILFNALGVDIGQGYTNKTKSRFKDFLDICLNEKESLITVRNDGAKKALSQLYGNTFSDKIYEVPDSGFFAPTIIKEEKNSPEWLNGTNKQIIGINLAGDMPEKRFSSFEGSVNGFCKKFSDFLEQLLSKDPNLHYVFLPHIYRDYEIIAKIFSYLDDKIRRESCYIVEYGPSDKMLSKILSVYSSCDIVLANRFHANVCALGAGKRTIGLVNYLQIKNFYEGLNACNLTVGLNEPNFEKNLINLITEELKKPTDPTLDSIQSQFLELRENYKVVLQKWLNKKFQNK